jgi:ankyrin repeat protein
MHALIKSGLLAVSLLLLAGCSSSGLWVSICRNELTPADYALYKAVFGDDIDAVEEALRGGANPNAIDPDSPFLPPVLSHAAAKGNPDIVSAMLEYGAKVDKTDSLGQTPLMWASAKGNVQVVRLLLESGANPTHKDYNGKTALDEATERDHQAILELLAVDYSERSKE